MALSPGTRLGPYEVLSAIGAGGMGEVYRARDSKLKRDVAIKVLPSAFARDPERLARFEREAEVLATLNHPHIAAVYGFEESADASGIVLELVDGPTLADRIAGGAIPSVEALPTARQIADALEAAHERGIVHRDLKPANIKLTADGQVKVLDFGLAKMLEDDVSDPRQFNVTASPTMLSPAMTGLGMILGTAAYMSPEQAAAKPVDKRADIWSFGVILWEMLTGQRLFDAETVSHTLADVLRAPIDLAKLPSATPPSIRELLRRCLERDVKNRLRDIGEARVTIDRVLSGNATVSAPVERRTARGAMMVAAAVAVIALVVAAGLAFVHFREQPPAAPLMRFQVLPPSQSSLDDVMIASPDGRKLALVATGADGRRLLWLREIDALAARPLPGTEGARVPFWSADSLSLGFGVDGAGGRGVLKKVDVSTGVIQTICGYSGSFRGGTWNGDGVIVFAGGSAFGGAGGLLRVSQGGGDPSSVTTVNTSRQEIQHALPTFLSDGRRFLYFQTSFAGETQGIYLGSLDASTERQNTTRLIAANAGVGFVGDSRSGGGWVLFLRQGSLFAQALDARASIVGDPQLLATDVGNTISQGWFSVSQTGTLTYRTGGTDAQRTELRWVDRQGKPLGKLSAGGDPGGGGVQLSHDGRRVVVTLVDNVARTRGLSGSQAARSWLADTSRGIFSRLNAGEDTESSPAIAPDGRVIFTSTANGAVGDLYWMDGNGIGKPEPLLLKSPTVKHPNSVSPDGRFLIFDDHSLQQRQDLWILPLDPAAGSERRPIPFLVTNADETFGQFSPDSRWIAYSSDESGRREVYVQGFAPDRVPAAAIGKWQISTAGGDKPRWRHDGRELYYISQDSKMMAVPIKSGPSSFEPGLAAPLFDTRLVGFFPYDVAPDGRFLINSIADSASVGASPVTVVLNWQAALKR